MSFGIGFGGKIGFAASGYPKKPTAPTSLTATSTTPGVVSLSWTAPVNTGFPAVSDYTVEIVGITTINTGNTNTTYSWSGGTKAVSYSFRVYANNSAGQSPASNTASVTVSGNVATGGTVTDISNYNGTGQTWRVHTFSSGTGTFSISQATHPFRYLVVAGGGSGGRGDNGSFAGGGGGGGGVNAGTGNLSVGSLSVTVAPTSPATNAQGVAGGSSSLGAITASGGITGWEASNGGGGRESGSPTSNAGGSGTFFYGGGGGGAGGVGGNGSQDTQTGGAGGAGLSNNISGTALIYGRGGNGGAGGNQPGNVGQGAPGTSAGIVIVSYQL